MNRKPRMSRAPLLAALLAVALAGCASVAAISDRDFSLNKGNVFEPATPAPFSFDDEAAGKTVRPLPGSGMPPMISHAVDEYLPLTLAKNECRDCHDKPAAIGKPLGKNKATPAPASHYTKNAAGAMQLAGMNFNCMACHAPQAGVSPLVNNSSR
ncbi:MAG: nitrate reductase cytochrome c-type subunit [Burkholderiaceae bacterium]|nr:nitrate reductase cytochrome c-type subunit [Burkholderiaceae bacterium]